jgi:tetratricopeptide (TPR) repeat protein
MSLGEHTEAISHFEKEIEMAPSAAHSHYMLGQARQQLGQYELAGRSYQAALKIQPDNMNALYGLAIVLTRLGDKTRAAECRRKYTELNRAGLKTEITRMSQSFDDDAAMRKLLVSAHREAGRAYASARRSDDAERHWRRAIAIDPGDLRCRTVLVNFFLHGRRNVSEARRLALAAVALDPSAAKWALLARSHHANGDMAPARAAVKRAIAEDPANQSYRQILRMIEGGI